MRSLGGLSIKGLVSPFMKQVLDPRKSHYFRTPALWNAKRHVQTRGDACSGQQTNAFLTRFSRFHYTVLTRVSLTAPYPKRTHTCGELTPVHAGIHVTLTGWLLPER
jgi:aspartyl-tRNA synthetase